MMKKSKLAIAITTALISTTAFATNGMNLEGYGPVSTAMGGTAQAYNNGLGGMMNNPATLGLGKTEGNKIQLVVGGLHTDIKSTYTTAEAKSTASFLMPGFGYATKSNGLTLGVGVLSQGGMGTDFGSGATLFAHGKDTGGTYNSMSGDTIRSEVGVGRLVFPVSFDVSDSLTIGGSLDYVWGGMDLQMDMDGATFGQLMQGTGGSASGSMVTGLQTYMGNGAVSAVNYARFDFSDNSAFTQATKGAGLAGKLGMVYKVSSKLTVGASYHSKTAMSDFEGDATMQMAVDGNFGNGALTGEVINVVGKIKVKDFQWPATFGLGVTYTEPKKWRISADVKQIQWSNVMNAFNIGFTADSTQTGYADGFKGTNLDVTMDQNWEDQTVIMIGGEYNVTDALAVRAGYNYASNPVPDATLNPLFPATVQSHITGGFGYNLDASQAIDMSMTIVPEVEATGGNGITTTHAQTNWQAMYTYKWGVK